MTLNEYRQTYKQKQILLHNKDNTNILYDNSANEVSVQIKLLVIFILLAAKVSIS
jgi:hypothetical protein